MVAEEPGRLSSLSGPDGIMPIRLDLRSAAAVGYAYLGSEPKMLHSNRPVKYQKGLCGARQADNIDLLKRSF